MILRESKVLFQKYGIRSISMDDIARELGVSKKTLYQHVSSKADLLEKGFEKNQCDFKIVVQELSNKNLNAIDELLEVSIMVNDEFKNFNPSTIFDLQKYYPDIFKKHVQHEKKFAFEMIFKNLEKGKKQGFYRKDQDSELITGLYIQKIQSIHDEEFLNQANFSMEKIFEVMFENHIRGISNAVGIAYFEQRKQQLNFQ
jgi:AcrR family transcriptional regulator